MSACPKCDSLNNIVKQSRKNSSLGNIVMKRRRFCLCCNARFNTYEIPESMFENYNLKINQSMNFDKVNKINELLIQIRELMK